MASTFSDLKVELIGTGDQSGAWGATTNTNLGTALGEAITGSADVSFSSADVTVTLTDVNTSQTARNLRLNLTGTTGGARNLILGSGCQIEKLYLINNGTADTVTVKNTTGTGIAVPAGKSMFVFNNGTNVVDAVTHLASLTLGSALPVASGGLGISSGTSGGILAFTGTGTLASSGALAANNVVLGGGAGVAPASSNLLAKVAAVTSGDYIQSIGYADTVVALGNTGTAINLDVVSGGVFTATLTGSATITLRYPVATGSSSFMLILSNDATPGRTIAWAGGTFKFPGGAASLSRTTTANAIDIWVFFTPDGGTTWYGNIAMKNMTT